MKDLSQTHLVGAAMNGDIDSFGELCTKYYSTMIAIAYSHLSDHHLAEDAAQETFARALENLRHLKSKEKFGAWLAQICRNVAKDWARIKLRNHNFDAIPERPDVSQPHHNIDAVRQAIASLPSAERQLITLRYFNDASHRQMADVLGLSKAAINHQLIRVKKKIAKYLKNNGFSEVEL